MPYIDKARRPAFEPALAAIAAKLSSRRPGELNYVVYSLVQRVLAREGMSYTKANALLGTVNRSVDELYRRLVAPYEDQAIKKNGDVVVPVKRKRPTLRSRDRAWRLRRVQERRAAEERARRRHWLRVCPAGED